MRVAIVHDYLVQYGGAERVVHALSRVWPSAPIYTSLYDPDVMGPDFAGLDVRTTPMERVPGIRRHSKLGLPLYPAAIRSLTLDDCDVVISSSSGWAHGVRAPHGAFHAVYCHTPARWLYRPGSYTRLQRALAAPLLAPLRRWDARKACKPAEYVANSRAVARRIRHQYGRQAQIIHPPVDTARFRLGHPQDYYLCVGRLTHYKRIDLAIAACERLGRRLVVAGDGPARGTLSRLASRWTELLGRVSDEQVAALLAGCRALIVPGEEDFCITAVEAMACGRPVIGYAAGGLLETVVPGRTGVLFRTPIAEEVAAAISSLEDRLEVDPARIRAHARAFDTARFQARIAGHIARRVGIAPPVNPAVATGSEVPRP